MGYEEWSALVADRRKRILPVVRIHDQCGIYLFVISYAGCCFCPLHGFAQSRKQHSGQDRDDGNRYEKLYQSEIPPIKASVPRGEPNKSFFLHFDSPF